MLSYIALAENEPIAKVRVQMIRVCHAFASFSRHGFSDDAHEC